MPFAGRGRIGRTGVPNVRHQYEWRPRNRARRRPTLRQRGQRSAPSLSRGSYRLRPPTRVRRLSGRTDSVKALCALIFSGWSTAAKALLIGRTHDSASSVRHLVAAHAEGTATSRDGLVARSSLLVRAVCFRRWVARRPSQGPVFGACDVFGVEVLAAGSAFHLGDRRATAAAVLVAGWRAVGR